MDYLGCTEECRKDKAPCKREACRHWMQYEEDLNCSIIAAEDHGPMTLEEVSKRIGLTLVRIKQIEEKAMTKVKKRILPILHE